MRAIGNAVLFIVEFCFKLAASLAAFISLGASGAFGNKIIQGFQSLPEAIREIVWWIQNIPEIGQIIDDYNTMTAANFNAKYGSGAINNVMDYLNEGVAYLQHVYLNLAEQPVTTILAAVIVFLVFYILARIARFIRQEGQGSFIDRAERRAGDRVFKHGKSGSSYDTSRWV